MDDGFNLFIFCRVSQRLTSQHFGISGNMVNVRYYFLIFFCCLLQAEAATLWVMRSHYTMITEVWFQALFPALSCQTYPSILWKEIWMVNIYPLSYFGEHYLHLCDACFSSELKVYSVFLTSPAQQICLQSILISVPDCRRSVWLDVCVCSFPLTCDIEPPLPMCLCHDDAHHVSDRLRFENGKGEVGLVERDWLSRGWWEGDPLDVEPRRGRAWGAALVCGFDLEINIEIKLTF